MISIFGVVVLGFCGWTAFNLFRGTTSVYARLLTLGSVALLAWTLLGP